VTGRPRRCGWFDAVATRHAARVSGSTELAVMLLDVLSGIEELNVATAYRRGGKPVNELPSSRVEFEECQPVYETLAGWTEDLSRITSWSKLPAPAQRYVEFLGSQLAVPVTIVSVGPERRQTILRR
jgi:adenylosuccinate synthase